MARTKKHADDTPAVDEYMNRLDHSLKREVQAAREIIKGVDPRVTEEVKWNAPSFSCCGEYLATFNLRAAQHVHLVFHNPLVAQIASPILEGDYPDRRMAYFRDLEDLLAKRGELERVLRELIARLAPG